MTEQEMLETIQARMKEALDGFINQPCSRDVVRDIEAAIAQQLTHLRNEGVLPHLDLAPDVVRQKPEDPNAVEVLWTDPRKIAALQDMGFEVY